MVFLKLLFWLIYSQPAPPSLPDRVLVNEQGVRVWHNYGNVNPPPGTRVEHAPIHFHVRYRNREYRVYGDTLRGYAGQSLPPEVEGVLYKNRSRLKRATRRIGKWYRNLRQRQKNVSTA